MNDLPFAELLPQDALRGLAFTGSAISTLRQVTFVLPTLEDPNGLPGWAARWGLGLARELASGGRWSVGVLTVGEPGSEELSRGLTHRRVGAVVPGMVGPVADRVSWELGVVLSEADVVVVSQPFTRLGEVVMVVSKALGKRTFAVDGGLRTSEVGASLGLAALMDGVICHSAYGRSILPPDVDGTVIRGGVDHRFFAPPQYWSGGKYCLVAAVGQPDPALNASIARSLPEDVGLAVYVEGSVDGWRALNVPGLRGVDGITIATRQQLRQLYQEAWITVIPPSWVEGAHEAQEINLLGLESMACGTAVLASADHPFSEYLEDGVTGVVSRTREGIVSELGRLLQERAYLSEIGRRARAVVERRYSIDRVAGEVSDLLMRSGEVVGPK